MSVGEYTGQTAGRRSYKDVDRDILAAKVATALRKGASIRDAANRHGISDGMVRNLAASYDFPLPSSRGDKNWPAKDDPGIKESTSYDWARRNWERSVRAARRASLEEADQRAWDMQAPAVWYDEFVADPPKATTAADVMRQVCSKHNISRDALVGPLRRREIVKARHEAAFRMIVEVGMSYPRAGRMLGGRDHTTILNSVRRHATSSPEAMAAYRSFQVTVETSYDALAAALIEEHFEKGASVNRLCKRHSVSRIKVMGILLDEADRRRRQG